jgi:hypothetical protein
LLIGNVEHDMADLADAERQPVRPAKTLQSIRVDHRPSPL